MKLIARAGSCVEDESVLCEVLDVLRTEDALILTSREEDTWMNVGPGEGALTDDYVVHTLHPALISVGQGCFDLWRTQASTVADLEELCSDLMPLSTNSFFDDV